MENNIIAEGSLGVKVKLRWRKWQAQVEGERRGMTKEQMQENRLYKEIWMEIGQWSDNPHLREWGG